MDCSPSPCPGYSGYYFKILPTDAPAAALATTGLSFADEIPNTTSTAQTVRISDLGSAPLTVSNVTVTGDYSITNGCTSPVAAGGGTCAVQVTFTPTALGERDGLLTIADNSAGSPRVVSLTGFGVVPAATVSPASLAFAAQTVGTTSASQPVTIMSGSPVALQITHIQTSGDFQETNNCGTTLTIVMPCTVNVTYSPTAAGNSTGTLTITDDAPDRPQTSFR